MDFISNQWTVGIVTSIISGLLVFFFTRKFFTNKVNKEYEQNIETTNNEILHSIRPLIVEKETPTKEIIRAILDSTAKKYEVRIQDLYTVDTLCNNLINEIMSNSFLSSPQKLELSRLINEIKNKIQKIWRMIYP